MKRMTKKEIKKYVREATSNNFNWKLSRCGFYIKNDKVQFFISYVGQGMDENIYNNDYEEIIYIEDIIEEYRRKEYNLEDIDTIIYENVNNMIYNYNERIEDIEDFIQEIKDSIGEEFTICEYDNFVQGKHNHLCDKSDSWDYFTEGDINDYLESGSYTYIFFYEDLNRTVNLNIGFEVIERNEEEICESKIKIREIILL